MGHFLHFSRKTKGQWNMNIKLNEEHHHLPNLDFVFHPLVFGKSSGFIYIFPNFTSFFWKKQTKHRWILFFTKLHQPARRTQKKINFVNEARFMVDSPKWGWFRWHSVIKWHPFWGNQTRCYMNWVNFEGFPLWKCMKFELVSYLGGARCLPAVWVIVKLSVKFAVRPFFGESRLSHTRLTQCLIHQL